MKHYIAILRKNTDYKKYTISLIDIIYIWPSLIYEINNGSRNPVL